MNTFDTKTKFLFLVLFLGIAMATYLSYQKLFIRKDFEIFDSEAEIEEEEKLSLEETPTSLDTPGTGEVSTSSVPESN